MGHCQKTACHYNLLFPKKEGSTQHTCTFLARVMVWFRATHSYPSRQKQTNTVAQIVSLTRSQHNKWRFLWIAQLGISQFNERTVAVSELPGYPGRRHLVSSWVEKNSVPPLNRRTLDWSVVLTIGRLCPIIPQDNIVASNNDQNFTRAMPGSGTFYVNIPHTMTTMLILTLTLTLTLISRTTVGVTQTHADMGM